MNKTKKIKRKKSQRFRAGKENSVCNEDIILPQHVFLYLHPTTVLYPSEDLLLLRPEIEVEHQFNKITTLSDHYTPRNIIEIDTFDIDKPTFSVTIIQDSLDDITRLADCPILLTLYVYTNRLSNMEEFSEENVDEEQTLHEVRIPMAQGHIDIIEYFNRKRVKGTETVFLYPIKNHGQPLTCKTVWEVYSLHPLLKNVQFSNYLFLTFDSLYNIKQELMDKCENLMANLSLISNIPNEKNDYDKIFICNFKMFSKSIIADQNLTKTWESLKSNKLENTSEMGITSECKIILNQLFSNLVCTENEEFNFKLMNRDEDYALTCNSIHRYVLTDDMPKILEDILSNNLYQIIIEICTQEDEERKVLLQGNLDLSIFMYPKVNNCTFAVTLRPPGHNKVESTSKITSKGAKTKRKSKSSQQQEVKEDKIPFAVVQICLHSPITNPCHEINAFSDQKPKHTKFCQYSLMLPKSVQLNLRANCDYNYKAFDDLILEIMDYIVQNGLKTLNDDKDFFCNQLGNMNNKIMKLLACDFNLKTPTKTNIEFMNLITTVYRDLMSRIYNNINTCSLKGLDNCVFTNTKVQNFILKYISLSKYLYEVGNFKMANDLMKLLRTEYSNNAMLNFYIFLYDIERQDFILVEKYLKSSMDEKDTEGELFSGLIQIYVNYELQLQDPERSQTAEEDLIKVLRNHSESQNPMPLTGFVLLYCLYKRHNYQPGMSYCRWRYENLFDSLFIKLEFIPKSRWEIYMPYKINLKTLKGQNFYKVCFNLLRLGLYTFAQWVFDEISHECLEIERYFFSSTFKILAGNLVENIQIKNFSVINVENTKHLLATLSLVNGNIGYLQSPDGPEYIKHYQDLAKLEEPEIHECCLFGLLRFAYKTLNEENYEESSNVFLKLCNDSIIRIAAEIGRGIACYHLGELDEAEKYLAMSTEHGIYMENIWAYLALINLKKGNNYNALECWKYARIKQNTEICQDILKELEKINYEDVSLFIDVPN